MNIKGLLFLFVLCFSQNSYSYSEKNFNYWKKKFIRKAVKQGLPKKFVTRLIKDVAYRKEVIKKDKNQITKNKVIDYNSWMKKWMGNNPSRAERGRELLKKHKKLLERVERKYKVDKEIIVSLWGVETFYGKIMGDHSIVEALVTLAYNPRRRKFFERELMAALRIVHEGHISEEQFLGSWAGALGQCQFMPTSFLMYAQDFDKDGKKDIWNNPADIFASIAYYLKRSRWKYKKSIGLLAKKTKNKNLSKRYYRSPSQYNRLGVRNLDGSRIRGNWRRKAATISMKNSPLLLRGSNYKSILKWNRSSLFAALNITLMNKLKKSH